jgi:hypothetical protein
LAKCSHALKNKSFKKNWATANILLEIGNRLCVPFTPGLGFDGRLAEMETFGNALGYAGRLQTLINPVHTKITFDGLAGIRVPLGGSPRTGGDAGFTTHTHIGLHKDNAVLWPFLHCSGRTCGYTPGILTVKAGHKYIRHTRQIVHFFGTDGNDLGQPRSYRQIIFGLTVGLAAVTSDAAFGVLVYIVSAHLFSSR